MMKNEVSETTKRNKERQQMLNENKTYRKAENQSLSNCGKVSRKEIQSKERTN